MPAVEESDGSAPMLWHERMSVAMALAESQHHTSRGQKMAKAGSRGTRSTTRHDDRSPGVLPVVRRGGRRRGVRPGSVTDPRPQRGSCGTPWSTLSTSCAVLPWCRFSMHLCRRRENSCKTSCLSSTRSCLFLFLSRLLKCPRSWLDDVPMRAAVRDTQLGNTWWKCRRSQCTLLWFSP